MPTQTSRRLLGLSSDRTERSSTASRWLILAGLALLFALGRMEARDGNPAPRPNIILVMSDDQGWGDVGYNGNPIVQTPALDAMAREGIRLDRFYAAAPVCTPTRASCLTGRHPYRMGLYWPTIYPLPASEFTLPEALKAAGYRTGHFGKWHLGTMSADATDGPRRMQRPLHGYSPPWNNGFDECFSAEGNPPLYNPLVWGRDKRPGNKAFMNRPVAFGETTNMPGVISSETEFWIGPGQIDSSRMAGDTSKILMDHALAFIEAQVAEQTPFFAAIWLFAPHSPIAAGNSHRAPYRDRSIEEQHWFGCITAMDEQIGRLRRRLKELNVSDDTIIWFCSDNGPSWVNPYRSTGPYRGEKGLLYEGGLRVPALLEWPARFPKPHVVSAPICTSDFYPTLLKWAGVKLDESMKPLDGIDVESLLDSQAKERPEPIGFMSPVRMGLGHDWMADPDHWRMNPDPATRQLAWTDNRFKLISVDNGKSFALYDLIDDPSETKALEAAKPEVVEAMREKLLRWVKSCDESRARLEYPSVDAVQTTKSAVAARPPRP